MPIPAQPLGRFWVPEINLMKKWRQLISRLNRPFVTQCRLQRLRPCRVHAVNQGLNILCHEGRLGFDLAGDNMEMTPHLSAFDHLVLTVADIDRTVEFYRDILGMQPVEFSPDGSPPRVSLKFGTQKINLHQAGAEFDPKAGHPMPGSADLCFLTLTSIDDWIGHLVELGIEIEEGPVARTGATGPLNSIYIRDPDSNLIEIANTV